MCVFVCEQVSDSVKFRDDVNDIQGVTVSLAPGVTQDAE